MSRAIDPPTFEPELEVCECECHHDGQDIMHFMECCELTSEKYIDKHGNFDELRWARAYHSMKHPPQPRKRKNR